MAGSQITSRFGATIRSLRYQLGISQEGLAERAGLHQTYISGIEAGGRNLTLNSIEKLARALQVSTATLLQSAIGPAEPSQTSRAGSSVGEFVDILMVEDNPDDVELTLRAFQHARITNSVQVVRDGKLALDFLFGAGSFAKRRILSQPQLVLLDLGLPEVSGLEVLRRIKADSRTRSIPVVILTASHDTAELTQCRHLGAETYILKPVDLPALSRATSRLSLDWALLKPPSGPGSRARNADAVRPE